jgi:hypothetical protein
MENPVGGPQLHKQPSISLISTLFFSVILVFPRILSITHLLRTSIETKLIDASGIAFLILIARNIFIQHVALTQHILHAHPAGLRHHQPAVSDFSPRQLLLRSMGLRGLLPSRRIPGSHSRPSLHRYALDKHSLWRSVGALETGRDECAVCKLNEIRRFHDGALHWLGELWSASSAD